MGLLSVVFPFCAWCVLCALQCILLLCLVLNVCTCCCTVCILLQLAFFKAQHALEIFFLLIHVATSFIETAAFVFLTLYKYSTVDLIFLLLMSMCVSYFSNDSAAADFLWNKPFSTQTNLSRLQAALSWKKQGEEGCA